MSIGDFPQSLSRAMLVGTMLLGRLGVMRSNSHARNATPSQSFSFKVAKGRTSSSRVRSARVLMPSYGRVLGAHIFGLCLCKPQAHMPQASYAHRLGTQNDIPTPDFRISPGERKHREAQQNEEEPGGRSWGVGISCSAAGRRKGERETWIKLCIANNNNNNSY